MSTSLSLDQANAIIAAAFAKGREMELKPLGIAVLDAGGHLIAFQRQDATPSMRVQLAIAKAAGGLALGVSSRKLAEMAEQRPAFIASLGPISPAGVVPAPGGVIIVDGAGRSIGAVGVTGDTSDNDEVCALAGIAAVGLSAQS